MGQQIPLRLERRWWCHMSCISTMCISKSR